MAVHWSDHDRQQNPQPPEGKPYRLYGINAEGKPEFYWSETKGEYAAYIGHERKRRIWGELDCASGKALIKPENRVFISDKDMAMRLQEAGFFRPCGHCNKAEFMRWKEEQGPNVQLR